MRDWQRWLIAGAAAAALVIAVGAVGVSSGLGSAAILVGLVGSLAGLLGGWFTWARRPPTTDDIDAVGKAVREEALKRSVGALPDLVSRQGLLDLGVEPRLRLVHDPAHEASSADVDDVQSAFKAANERLLIVGEPASGKTVAAYRLAGVIAKDTEGDRVPLLVNLSAWADQDSFEDFLVDYMCAAGAGYGITNRKAAAAWVDQRSFGLILDGLDEVPATWRGDVLKRLDEWLPVGVSVALTCRTREYDDLIRNRHRGVGLTMAVRLEPLNDDQLDKAFTEIAARGHQSWADLIGRWKSGQRQAVRETLRRPLTLNLAVATGVTAEQLRQAGKAGIDEVRSYILDKYIAEALRDDNPAQLWTKWIAAYLTARVRGPFGTSSADPTVFELGSLTPDRIPLRYALMAFGPLWLFSILPFSYLYHGSFSRIGASTAMVLWLVGLLFVPLLRNARPSTFKLQAPPLRLSILAPVMLRALLAGVLVGLAGAVVTITTLFTPTPVGILVGVPTVFLYALWELLLRPSRARVGPTPDSPWRRSMQSALRLTLLFGCASILAVTLTWLAITVLYFLSDVDWTEILIPDVDLTEVLIFFSEALIFATMTGLLVGVCVGLTNGGWYLLAQTVGWRRLQRRYGLDPWPLVVLVRGTVSRNGAPPILRPVGSGVRFIHNDVRDRLAGAAEFAGEDPPETRGRD